MKDSEGNILTTDEEIITEAAKHYKTVFEETVIDEDLNEYKIDCERLCQLRPESAAQNKTPTW